MIIQISAADLAAGVPHDEYRCAIAQSVRRQTGDFAAVGDDGVVFCEHFNLYPVGPKAAEFITDFDEGYVLSPTALPYQTKRAWE